MNNAIFILFSAFVDSFRPKMLMLTLVSVVLALVFWLVIVWFLVDPLVNVAIWALSLMGLDFSPQAVAVDTSFLQWLKWILVPLAVFGLLWPIVATSAVLLAGLYVTPPVVNYLTSQEFQGLQKKGSPSMLNSLWVMLKSVLVFLMCWLLTLPLWLIPGLALLLPVLLTAYLLMSVMRFDALAGHASKVELIEIKKRNSPSAWVIGLVCTFLSFIPPLLLIMPVMSALAFTRHYMGELVQLRAEKVINMTTQSIYIDSH